MATIRLATFDLMPDGEPGGELIVDELARRDHTAWWSSWDDPSVDWGDADLVVVRSTWDYSRRLTDFLAWTRRVEAVTRLSNGADVIEWNADKRHLLDLAAHLPVIPTRLVDDRALRPGLQSAIDRWGEVVIKPRVGASGVGLVVATSVQDPRLEGLLAGPWIAQPLVEAIRTHGEISVFVFGGKATSQVNKQVGRTDAGESTNEVRVHGAYGGNSSPAPLDPDLACRAEEAVAVASRLNAFDLAYARVDLMMYDGQWTVSELELIEPGLYLDIVPDNAAPFAELIDSMVRAGR